MSQKGCEGGGVGCVVVAIMESCLPWGMKKRGSRCLVRRVNLLVGVCVGCNYETNTPLQKGNYRCNSKGNNTN